jgi:hypothetical protein
MSYFNHPVKVAVFQAAIGGLVERLIRKAGRSEAIQMQVVFTGAQACAVWATVTKRGADVIRGTIKLPELRAGSVIDREKANRWVGYVIHEVWHVIFTDSGAWNSYAMNNPGLRKNIANALEDARIERSGMELGYADGFNVVGRDLLSHMLVTGGMDINPNEPAQIPFVFAIGCRAYGIKGEKRLLSALDPRIKAILDEAKRRVDNIPATVANVVGTTTTNAIATWVFNELKKLGKSPPPMPPDDVPVNPGPRPKERTDRDDDPERDDTSEREEGSADDETYDDENAPQGPPDEDDVGGNPGMGDLKGTPLQVGDKVECPDGSIGKIVSINDTTAEVAPL